MPAVALALASATLVAPSASLAGGDANRTQCPSGTENSPGFQTYLPDCRAYELVTPPYKAGAVVLSEPAAISTDGTHIIFAAGGAFAGAGNDWWQANSNPNFDAYEATRGEPDWETKTLTPPATEYSYTAALAASTDLTATLWGTSNHAQRAFENIDIRSAGGAFLPVGPGIGPELDGEELISPSEALQFAGASQNLSRLVFSVEASSENNQERHNGHNDLWPGDTTKSGDSSLYEYTYSGAASAEPALVGVANNGRIRHDTEAQLISHCGTQLGSLNSREASGSAYNAVSKDGETVFFTALGCERAPAVNELYARVGDAATVAISEPPKEDCEACDTAEPADAIFEGANQSGEKAFFLTQQKLLSGQEGMNLYEYDFGRPAASAQHPDGKIVLVSGEATNPEVQGVVRIAENGERVYFVAKAKLAYANAEGKEPEEGADNLYVYEPDPAHPRAYRTVFVAKLLTGAEEATLKAAELEEQKVVEEEALYKYVAEVEAGERRLSRGEITSAEYRELEAEALQAYGVFIRTMPGTLGPTGTLAEDRSVWQSGDSRPAQATPDGEYLVFVGSADLTEGDESSLVPQVFEYDAATQRLIRVSIGRGGTYHSDGSVRHVPRSAADSRPVVRRKRPPDCVAGESRGF